MKELNVTTVTNQGCHYNITYQDLGTIVNILIILFYCPYEFV